MREDVVVSKCRNDRDVQATPAGVGEELGELVSDPAVGAQDLLLVARDVLVAVMAGAVASPDNKVDVVFDVGRDPVECGVDKGEWGVAVGCLCAVGTCWAFAAMARVGFVCG